MKLLINYNKQLTGCTAQLASKMTEIWTIRKITWPLQIDWIIWNSTVISPPSGCVVPEFTPANTDDNPLRLFNVGLKLRPPELSVIEVSHRIGKEPVLANPEGQPPPAPDSRCQRETANEADNAHRGEAMYISSIDFQWTITETNSFQ